MRLIYSTPAGRHVSRGNIKETNLRPSSSETDFFSLSGLLTVMLINVFMKNVAWDTVML